MKRRRGPPLFLNEEHRRNYDVLIERRSDARMWLRARGRLQRERAPDVPALIAQQSPSARMLRAV